MMTRGKSLQCQSLPYGLNSVLSRLVLMHQNYGDSVRIKSKVKHSTHYMAEEIPTEVAAHMLDFFLAIQSLKRKLLNNKNSF